MEKFKVWGKIAVFRLQQKTIIFGKTILFFSSSCYFTLYVMDLFGFRPKFGPYHCAELPRHKRVT